jgi:putative component of toxin-antitoxin plasmid stabilization module
MFRVFRFAHLDSQRARLSQTELERLNNLEQQLVIDPRGKMLGLPFFREKRLNGKRLLFLVYEKEQVVLIVMVTDKKCQQKDIEKVKRELGEFQKYVQRRLGRTSIHGSVFPLSNASFNSARKLFLGTRTVSDAIATAKTFSFK